MKLYVRQSGQHGKGAFASEPIREGEAIIVFGGRVLHRSEIDFDDYHLQIGEALYLGPSGVADDYINHSCQPNSAFRGGLTLFALRDIGTDEEVTWDYSTAIDEEDFAGFPCACGSVACRGLVRSFRHLPAEVQLRLRPMLLSYLSDRYFPR
ncbi:MAG: SET domain-containing protein [Acidiferrobacterales bacterium]